MDESKTTEEESTDQPIQESTDQPVEESQDQPAEEVEGGDEEGTETGEVIEIDGVEYNPEELKELVAKGKDYTFKTQQLAQQRKQLERVAQQPQAAPTAEEQNEIKQAKELAQKYGFAMKDDVERNFRVLQAQMKLAKEFEDFTAKSGVTAETAEAVRVLADTYAIPYQDAHDKFFKGAGNRKVVKRKVVGAKASVGTGVSKKNLGTITRESIAKMTPEQYKENRDKIQALVEKGEL